MATPTSTACPSPDQLQGLLSGDLSAADQDALTRHIETCPSCQQTLDGWLSSPSLQGLAAAGKDSATQEAALRELMAHVKWKSPGDATQAEPVAGSPSDLGYLEPGERPGVLGRLGSYEVLEVLGKGGFGTVFKAHDTKLQRIVAIKVLAPELAANGSARRRFIREAQAGAAIKNEHVVAIHNVENEHQPPYIVMEMIDGISLQDRLDRDGLLELKEILRIGLQIAEGLAAAHKQGLIHRDIKPANILLENGVQRVKITDFGLARAADDASITQSGVIAGTPMYMAPEQAQGEALDPRADLFSLGSVLYTLCTGRPPFRAANTLAVLKRVCEEEPRPIREVNPEIPDWLSDLIAKLHAKQAKDRYGSAQEIADVLSEKLAELQFMGRATTGRAAAAGPALATPLAAPLLATPPRRRRLVRLVMVAALLLAACVGIAAWLLWRSTGTLIVDVESDPGRVGADVLVKIMKAASEVHDASDRNWHEGSWGGRAFDLRTGRYLVEVGYRDKKLGFGTFSQEVTIKAGQVTTVKVPADFFVAAKQKPPPKEDQWTELFNGKDLDGWIVAAPGTGQGGWQVDRSVGQLVGRGPQRSYAFTRRDDFADFHLRTEVSCTGGTDSGIFFRCGKDLLDGQVPAGYEVNTGFELPFHPGALLVTTPESRKPQSLFNPQLGATMAQFHPLEILARGNRILIKMDGETVTDYTDAQATYRKGRIALQVSSSAGRGTVYFKKIEIKELPPAPRAEMDAVWAKQVAAMPPEKQVDAVGARLKDLNPGFDGALTHRIVDGVVTELRLVTDRVTDISPLQVFNGLRVLDCSGTASADWQRRGQLADLTPLQGMKLESLTELHLSWTMVRDADLAAFKDCTQLTQLWLSGSPRVSDAGFAHFEGCKKIRLLGLTRTRVSDAGLAHFKDLKDLTQLQLYDTDIGDAGLAHFKDCQELELLGLVHTKVSDRGLLLFKDCKQLTHLNLGHTKVGNAGLAHLKSWPNLKGLVLIGTKVTDAGVDDIKACKGLVQLNLRDTKVTAGRIEELKAALPACRIEWDGDAIEPHAGRS